MSDDARVAPHCVRSERLDAGSTGARSGREAAAPRRCPPTAASPGDAITRVAPARRLHLVPSERLTAIAGANTPVWPVRTRTRLPLWADESFAFLRRAACSIVRAVCNPGIAESLSFVRMVEPACKPRRCLEMGIGRGRAGWRSVGIGCVRVLVLADAGSADFAGGCFRVKARAVGARRPTSLVARLEWSAAGVPRSLCRPAASRRAIAMATKRTSATPRRC
jgi:hypothetical protein